MIESKNIYSDVGQPIYHLRDTFFLHLGTPTPALEICLRVDSRGEQRRHGNSPGGASVTNDTTSTSM